MSDPQMHDTPSDDAQDTATARSEGPSRPSATPLSEPGAPSPDATLTLEQDLIEDLRVVIARRAADPSKSRPEVETLVGRTLAQYEVKELLGEGGMARVYRAVDTHTGQDVALKALKREYQASADICVRFEREAMSMARIQHPNVVRIYGCPSDGNATAIAMELLTGGSLRDLLQVGQKRKRRLGIKAITRFAAEAARGLGAAHEAGIVHRDIKPANLLLDAEGTVKVADFGVVLALERATWLTGLGRQVGTPAYMSPEQCKGERVSPASDVYSLGVTLFELATGRLPFEEEAGSPFALMLKHIREPAPNPRKIRSNLPDWLAWVVLKCLDKIPEQRYESGNALAESITGAPFEPDLTEKEPDEPTTAWRINPIAIREQLKRLPQRAIVSWACRCARRVQILNTDPRLDRSISMAETTLADSKGPEPQEFLAHALQRVQQLRAASFKATYSAGGSAAADPAAHAALAAAAAGACAAARCVADAAADAAFAAQSALTALELAKQPIAPFWQAAQSDYQKLLAARLGAEGTIGRAIPSGFWQAH